MHELFMGKDTWQARDGAELFARALSYIEAFLTSGSDDTPAQTGIVGDKEVTTSRKTFRSTDWKKT